MSNSEPQKDTRIKPSVVEEEDTIGNPRIRKRKSPSRETKEKKNKSLDEEGLVGEIKKIHTEEIETFFCFRCQEDRCSKNKYEWETSDGVKIICNGCNGNLLSSRARPIKVKVDEFASGVRPEPTSLVKKYNNKGKGNRGGRGWGRSGGRGGGGKN